MEARDLHMLFAPLPTCGVCAIWRFRVRWPPPGVESTKCPKRFRWESPGHSDAFDSVPGNQSILNKATTDLLVLYQ